MSFAPSAVRRRLSVAMIVRDAADSLPETLASIQAIADEIVVVDTGSIDATPQLAQQRGAQVVNHVWNDSFSAARNVAATHVTGDWVLWLDAGERLTADSAAALRRFIDEQADPGKAYMLLVMIPPAPGNISGEQAARIRLLPNRPALRFVGRVREQVRPAVEAAGLLIEGLPWRILRGPRENDPQTKALKARRDVKLVDLEIQEHGRQPRLLNALGEALSNLGDYSGAAACFRNALKLCPPGSTTMRDAYYGLLSAIDSDEAQRPSQLAVCLEALEAFPLDAQLLCAMGGYLQAQEQLPLAARAYQTAAEYGQVDPEVWHLPDIAEIAAVCLSLIHQLQDQDDAACRALENALERHPDSVRLRRHLIDLHVKHNRRREALAEFDRLPPDTPHREALRSAIRGACLAARQNWIPALAYLQTAYSAGCRDLLCVRWLAVALLSNGEVDSALPILHVWQSLEPRSTELRKYLDAVGASGLLQPPAAAIVADESRHLRIDAPQMEVAHPAPAAPKINVTPFRIEITGA